MATPHFHICTAYTGSVLPCDKCKEGDRKWTLVWGNHHLHMSPKGRQEFLASNRPLIKKESVCRGCAVRAGRRIKDREDYIRYDSFILYHTPRPPNPIWRKIGHVPGPVWILKRDRGSSFGDSEP
jgi:hypothetical protein